ncbi:MFS transporter [Pseudonocardia sp. GCM10023141]|uniref:MFS transporter n=1 Tax=Pseudonocardia sp. GCM10023141 TaxID=3252653 RepID=UPI0036D37324
MSTAREPELPVALRDPTERVGIGWTSRLSLNLVGMWIAWYAPLQVLLGLHAAAIAPAGKEFVFGLASGLGGLTSMVVNPLVGALSDRTTSRFGRRVPWVVGGGLVAAAGLVVLSVADGVGLFVIGWCLTQAGLNTMLGSLTAFLPDQVPHAQRATVGGVVALATTVGVLAGTGLAAAFGAGRPTVAYLVCAGIVLLFLIPNVLFGNDAVLPSAWRPPVGVRAILAGYWISPREHPDFGWAWLSRLLINLGNAVGTVYLLFYLQDAVGYTDPATGVFILTLLYAIAVAATAVVAGPLSDRIARRKVFVIVSGSGVAAALVILCLQTWTAAVVGAVLLGIAYGTYTAVDLALVTEVLPASVDRAKDLGIIAITSTLPSLLATVVAGVIVTTLGGYLTLYLVAGGLAVVGALLVTRIRGVT